MTTHDHWQQILGSDPSGNSWVQERPGLSLEMIAACGLGKDAGILDMGGGASTLVDFLLADGFSNITVADISETSLELAQKRLGELAKPVQWIVADACNWQPPHKFDLWHDRAVFHFLTEDSDRKAYKQRLYDFVPIGGFLIMATFAIGGPTKCSGLDIVQYDAQSLANEIGVGFVLLDSQLETHTTPGGASQNFQYIRMQRV
ncbi:MAG: class I SAM-dependent methyltransferase [Robiginitomaculum sp.]|nr:class I SAM-dependent methyltransferase [Robiginitomaculum sp.]